jgi:hypothetical protein
MLKTILATLIAAITASAIVYLVFHGRVNRLQAENQELLAQRDNPPPPQTAAPEEPAPPRTGPADTNEISQLRLAAGALRQQTEEMKQTLQAEKASFQAQQLSAQAKREAAELILTIRVYTAEFGNDLVLTNLDQFKTLIPGISDTNLALREFEIVPNPTPWNTNCPEALVVRERSPRPTADGKWARVYGLVDGSITERISADGYFDAWEKEHLMPSRNSP